MHKSLIYHIYADGDPDTLAFNLAHLRMYTHVLDSIYIKIVYDDIHKIDLLRPYLNLASMTMETVPFIMMEEYPNVKHLGENVGLMDCLEHIHIYSPDSLILFGGANGVSKTTETHRRHVRAWVKALYHLSLGNINHVETIIKSGKHCYGSFQRTTPMDKGGPYPCPWHYSGHFYWLNGTELFKRNWDTALAPCRHGIEMYPGYIFNFDETYCHFNTQADMYETELKTEEWVSCLS